MPGRTHKAWGLGRGDPETSEEDRAFGPSLEDWFQLPQVPAAGRVFPPSGTAQHRWSEEAQGMSEKSRQGDGGLAIF